MQPLPNEKQVVLFELFKMNQNQFQEEDAAAAAADIAAQNGCAAADYGCCSVNDVKDRDIIFMRRNMKLGPVPDEEVKVSMCGFHYTWLVATNKGVEPLEMRGKFLDTAIGEDLLSAFEPINPITRNSRLFTFWSNTNVNNHCIFNGNDTFHAPTKFEDGWRNAGVIHYDSDTGVLQEFEPISKEMCELIAQAQERNERYKVCFYTLPNDGVHCKRHDDLFGLICQADCWCLEVDDVLHFFENPIDLPDAIYNYVNSASIKFKTSERDAEYDKCLDFILVNVSEDIMKMSCISNKNCESPVPLSTRKTMLFDCADTLMTLLTYQDKENIDYFRVNKPAETDFASILWFVYTYTNNALYTAHDAIGKYNEQLVELFVEEGLEKQLLAIAISGERERYVDNHQRCWHDILYESESVVKALVPAYVTTNDIIQPGRDNNVTPIQYWHYFDDTVFNVCTLESETFEKNTNILEYLELHRL